jgi:transcriptional regulator with XRE-family HTH domain/Zn-dependent peptidase ImmA (M78 family)
MTVDKRYWEEPEYGEIVEIDPGAEALTIEFANGDRVEASLGSLGADAETKWTLDNEGSLIAVGPNGEREIDWMGIRARSDAAFAADLRERDAEESRRIGRRLRALRDDSGMSQKTVAETAGMSPPQLAKIEKGESDLRISTLSAVLRALNADFGDIAGPDAPEVSMKAVRLNAQKSGAPAAALKELASRLGPRRYARVIAHGFGWDVDGLLSGPPPARELQVAVSFKSRDPEKARSSPLVQLARTVSEASAAVYEASVEGLPVDPGEIRSELEAQGGVTLESLTSWAWDRGVIVIPTPWSQNFNGAAWYAGERPVVVLSSSQRSPAFWLFDLAHELGHIALGHPAAEGVVEIDKPGKEIDDRQEEEANRFALDLLVPESTRLFEEIRRRSAGSLQFQKEKFKWKVIEVAREEGIDEAVLATTAASALIDVAEEVDRWGSAQNIAKEQGEAMPQMQAAFAERIDVDAMPELDAALVRVVVLE